MQSCTKSFHRANSDYTGEDLKMRIKQQEMLLFLLLEDKSAKKSSLCFFAVTVKRIPHFDIQIVCQKLKMPH